MKAPQIRRGQSIALLGMLLLALAIADRFAGNHTLGGLAAGTFMFACIRAVCVACFPLLWSQAQGVRR